MRFTLADMAMKVEAARQLTYHAAIMPERAMRGEKMPTLPGPLKQAIESRTGRITGVRIASAGQNSPLAAVIDARDGKVFAKGLPSAHRRVIAQAREVAVARSSGTSPRPCCGISTRPGGTSSAMSTEGRDLSSMSGILAGTAYRLLLA